MRTEIFFELYRDSWRRRDQLAGEVVFPIGILTVLWGVLVYFVRTFRWDVSSMGLRLALLFAIAAASLSFVVTIWHLLRSYHGYAYATNPMSSDLIAHRQALLATVDNASDVEAFVAPIFNEYLCSVFASAADLNAASNEMRVARLYRMRRALVWTTLLTVVCAIPWIAMQART